MGLDSTQADIPVAYSDINTTSPYYDATKRLSSLGIMQGYPDNTFRANENITKAQMAKIVVKALGLTEADVSTKDIAFTDVDVSHWAYNYIRVANDLCVINGNGDGTFSPDDNITHEQAIKMIVSAIGYKPQAETQEGYPTGYLTVAERIKITDEINVRTGQPITRGDVALITNKALDVPLMEETGSDSDITYQIQDGSNGTSLKTLMTEKFGGNIPD